MKWILLTAVLPSLTLSQIVSGSAYLGINQDLNFITSTNATKTTNISQGIGLYPCSTSTNTIDFSIQNSAAAPCICPCYLPVVSSPRPFYISKKGFYTMNLRTPLVLSDTSLYIKVDSITIASASAGVQPGRYLPFRAFDQRLSLTSSDSTLIIKTNNNFYVMIRLRVVADTFWQGPPPEPDYGCGGHITYGGYPLQWYLQQNHSTDFSQVDQTRIITNRSAQRAIRPLQATLQAFDILGRRVSPLKSKSMESHEGIRLIVSKENEGKLFLILRQN